MKKLALQLLSIVLVIALAVGAIPVNATATEQQNITLEYVQMPSLLQAAPNYLDPDAAAMVLCEGMQQRQAEIVVHVKSQEADYNALFLSLMDKACAHSGVPTAGDYLQWQRGGCGGKVSYLEQDATFYYTFTYLAQYYTTAQQEQQLDAAVDALLEELDLYDKTDYEKVLGVYDYMTREIVYDYENLENEEYKLKYTAYAALIHKTAVCQGYANLFYRLMLELGVDCRLIAGIGNGGGHAWNIVRLEGKYYNVDATWDHSWVEAGLDYEFFLRCEENFDDHYRDAEFDTAAFHAQYPMAENDYVPVLTVPGDANGDGMVDGNDATLLLQYAAGWPVQIAAASADANGDGAVDGNDATLLLQYAAGWPVVLGAA